MNEPQHYTISYTFGGEYRLTSFVCQVDCESAWKELIRDGVDAMRMYCRAFCTRHYYKPGLTKPVA